MSHVVDNLLDNLESVLIELGFNRNEDDVRRAYLIADEILTAEAAGEKLIHLVDILSSSDRIQIKQRTLFKYIKLKRCIDERYGSLENLLNDHKRQKSLTLKALYIEFDIAKDKDREEVKKFVNAVKKHYSEKYPECRKAIREALDAVKRNKI